jgi:hypothetical protein
MQVSAATCAADGVIQERLARGFGESLERQGPARAGHRLELWSNPVRGTWTVLVITPDGLACLAASGRLGNGRAPFEGIDEV